MVQVEELRQAQSKVVTREGEILELETSRWSCWR